MWVGAALRLKAAARMCSSNMRHQRRRQIISLCFFLPPCSSYIYFRVYSPAPSLVGTQILGHLAGTPPAPHCTTSMEASPTSLKASTTSTGAFTTSTGLWKFPWRPPSISTRNHLQNPHYGACYICYRGKGSAFSPLVDSRRTA